MGRPFDIARSNYVVTDYHTELVQIIIALEQVDLSISDYSFTFDESSSLFKSIVINHCTYYLFDFGSLQMAFTN